MDRQDHAGCEQKMSEDKVRGIVQKCTLSLKLRCLADDCFGGGVAFQHISFQDVFAIARQWNKVVHLDLQQRGEKRKVVEICSHGQGKTATHTRQGYLSPVTSGYRSRCTLANSSS